MSYRVGVGYDSHRLVEGRSLILGGVNIPFEKGLLGHSDGDALCHAIIDALLGASGLGNIGSFFPDTSAEWKDADSMELLKKTISLCREKGFSIINIDTVIIIEKPKIAPHIEAMKQALSKTGLDANSVSIKPKTNEGMGFTGRGEGVAVHAVCLLKED
ncbi:MAG: 2-C-methyl-D-erythritol 2,4-cyclodiphosphate synthase [Dissulfurispiraceae bacterium]|jgi:2-C-methyl-D-erythritol 2,4-cyclodiphosphate synthase|nr:2-C-methyl-D-erythritol 2,4-cyclodiphosphate synthase [Dissulfurispiraceae bacterium]